jgi:predicted chitinase
MHNKFGNKWMFYGVVEDRMDPLFLGRCRCRVVGIHTDNKVELPTKDLPWAYPLQAINSAAMSGVGQAPLGPVEGTWVVVTFNDDSYQQPFMLGAIGGIPQLAEGSAAEIDNFLFNDIPAGTVRSGSGGIVVDGSGQPITAPATVASPTQATSITDDDLSKIPTVPPSEWKGDRNRASAGIKSIISACKAAGITKRNAVASILGIVGGESGWIPQDEQYNYSPTRMREIFKVSDADVEKYARAPSKGMSRETFFEFFYGPTRRGANFLGNKTDADGGKFYGRGLIQLTGRANYSRYGGLAGVDLLNNSNVLNTDLEISAKVAVAYFKDRCRTPFDSSKYFDGAIAAVGHNSKDIAVKKRTYYEYFLGGEQPLTDASPLPEPTKEVINKKEEPVIPTPSKNTDTSQVGFSDPNKKYPLKDWIKEPDTHRLARRQKIQSTIHREKEEDREKNISIANTSKTWDQMNLPYNGRYPYNHVYQSESGHVMEFDDTQNAERIHLYHTAGTFFEVDSEGNKSEKIVGGSSQVVDEDSLVCISGARHTHVSSDDSLIIGGQLQLQVFGNVTIVVNGNLYQTVSGNTNITTGGNFNIKAGGAVNIQSGGNFNVDAPQVHLNSGTSSSPDATPGYSPSIVMPKPITIDEATFIEVLEDRPERRKQIERDEYDKGEQTTVEKSDTNATPPQNKSVTSICDFPGNLTYETRLSENFTIGSLCFEQGRPFPFGGSQQGLSDKEIACNMKQLCVNILEPLRAKYKDFGFKLNSGFRVGKGSSQHYTGQAADISFTKLRSGPYSQQLEAFYNMAVEIRDSGLPFDQMIFESSPKKGWVWIHLSFKLNPRPLSDRTKVMSWVEGSGKGYVPGIHKVVL